ncbi:MAG: GntR family transcriptional regulator, partial [Gaiellales bacterium]
TEALTAHYHVVREGITYRGEELEIYDVMGLESTLFRWSAGGDDEQVDVFVRDCRNWFDSLWTTIATPLADD